MENRSKIEEATHILYQQDTRVSWASAQIFCEITFAQGHSYALGSSTPVSTDIVCPTPARISPSHFLPSLEMSRVHIQEECGLSLWLLP